MRFTKLILVLFLMIAVCVRVKAQDAVNYQTPPPAITGLLLAKPTPLVSIDSKAEWMLLSERNSYPTVEELGQPEIHVAGLRLNPNNFAPTRQNYISNFKLKNIRTNAEYRIAGLPANLLAGNITWNPSETKIAFLSTTPHAVDIYVIDAV
ncbi:MAG TPA: hypothetical protein VNV85_03910, partial [Puia sp.]|nr:hypothetical protein [Puia sp.]